MSSVSFDVGLILTSSKPKKQPMNRKTVLHSGNALMTTSLGNGNNNNNNNNNNTCIYI